MASSAKSGFFPRTRKDTGSWSEVLVMLKSWKSNKLSLHKWGEPQTFSFWKESKRKDMEMWWVNGNLFLPSIFPCQTWSWPLHRESHCLSFSLYGNMMISTPVCISFFLSWKSCFDLIILPLTSRGNLNMSISVGLFPHLLSGAKNDPGIQESYSPNTVVKQCMEICFRNWEVLYSSITITIINWLAQWFHVCFFTFLYTQVKSIYNPL